MAHSSSAHAAGSCAFRQRGPMCRDTPLTSCGSPAAKGATVTQSPTRQNDALVAATLQLIGGEQLTQRFAKQRKNRAGATPLTQWCPPPGMRVFSSRPPLGAPAAGGSHPESGEPAASVDRTGWEPQLGAGEVDLELRSPGRERLSRTRVTQILGATGCKPPLARANRRPGPRNELTLVE